MKTKDLKHLLLLTLMLSVAHLNAAIIGSDNFDSYADGAIAGQTGGSGWNWDNTGKSNTVTVSDWTNVGGAPQVSSQALLTSGNSSAKREFNGPTQGTGDDTNPTDERLGAFRGTGIVYFRTSYKWNTDNAWSGISGYDFGTERAFFGVPSNQTGTKYFGISFGGRFFSTVPVTIGQTYDIVAEINFNSDILRMWVDPTSGNDEPDIATTTTSGTWMTAVRVGSGGETQWDNIVVATHWSDLGFQPKAGLLLYDGFDGYSATNLPTQSITGTGFRSGSSWSGDSPDDSTFETNGLIHPRLIVSEGSGMATTKGDGGSGTYAYLDLGVFDRAGLLGSDTYVGIAGGESDLFVGGSDVEGILYYSFLAKSNTGTGSNAFAGFQLYRDGSEVCLIGSLYPNATFSGFAPNGNTFNLNSANSDRAGDNYENVDTDVHLFVVRIDYHADANDDITIWMDPEIRKDEAVQSSTLKTVSTSAGDLSFNNFHLRSGNTPNSWSYDEIRFGTDWRSVLPLIEYPLGTIIMVQ